ncbi:MAG: DUF2461 domain-containing protein [Gammaproteobacteria bacterium]|nr:DUF2461 domain-containing protein [Gammaproteobacteria bacterium]
MGGFTGFPKGCIPFLEALSRNNDREWFGENKQAYESEVREPALAFIESMAPGLRRLSPHFRAIPKKIGGSLMRVYRDIRYTKDKTPYKTNIGIQFRHELGRDVHAPGYYVHIQPGGCFIGVGIWRPESRVLAKIRDFVVDNPASWQQANNYRPFKSHYALEGESLKRPPRGYPPEHPLVEDLKRKDFIACSAFDDQQVCRKDFSRFVAGRFRQATPFMNYLCSALEVQF